MIHVQDANHHGPRAETGAQIINVNREVATLPERQPSRK